VLYTRLYGLTARGRGYAENRGADARVATYWCLRLFTGTVIIDKRPRKRSCTTYLAKSRDMLFGFGLLGCHISWLAESPHLPILAKMSSTSSISVLFTRVIMLRTHSRLPIKTANRLICFWIADNGRG